MPNVERLRQCTMAEERQLHLRDWLFALLEVDNIPGLEWVDKDKQIFAISWRHGRKRDWTSDIDSKLFKEWAVYKKRYIPGDEKKNARLWKSRFRCALNALCDIRELKSLRKTKGENAKKIYQFIQKSDDRRLRRKRELVKKELSKSSRLMVCTLDEEDLEANKTIEDFLSPKEGLNIFHEGPFIPHVRG